MNGDTRVIEYLQAQLKNEPADKLMDRLFMLDALPNPQDLDKLNIREDVPELLGRELMSEQAVQTTIKEGMDG